MQRGTLTSELKTDTAACIVLYTERKKKKFLQATLNLTCS